ncbi:hypothetical protein AAFC00_003734 [Neodothiora populina]|uniref:SRP54-type proteins GTP-binding domain-containing protein n=1 Tax=Neodothiora populina TaxID=2781224 RepID=A0ABR3PGD6_9PEZI
MLDAFEILTTSGVVLWSKSYAPVSSNVVNSLISDVFIEDRLSSLTISSSSSASKEDTQSARNTPFKKDKHTVKWTTAKDLGLIFVAVYQSILHLPFVDDLLDVTRALFIKQYGKELKMASAPSRLDCSPFAPTFDALVAKLDKTSITAESVSRSDHDSTSAAELTPPSSTAGTEDGFEEPPPPPPPVPALKKAAPKHLYNDTTSTDATPVPTPDTSRPSSPAVNHILTGKAGPPAKATRRSRRLAAKNESAPASSGDESPARKSTAKRPTAKSKRTWDAHGFGEDDGDTVLDYSTHSLEGDVDSSQIEDVRTQDMGSRTNKGQFVLKDLDDEVDAILAQSKSKQTHSAEAASTSGLVGTGIGAISGYFKNIVGGKTLAKEDLVKPLKAMEDHLLNKNVAREAAVRLCESVERDLLGTKTTSFTTIDATIRSSMSKALTKILTPTSSLDLLRAITTTNTTRPYIISIVGVNGVGKSTSLSKIAFFLLQNNFRVLVCAADTFRSGAVEQLRVHVRNLSELAARENVGTVELFEQGYGKDAATVARDAVAYANTPSAGKPAFDVVLIDTAGRRHNDTRLMSSLTKFGQLANPDKIFMVGEALVGTDSVAQARNFSAQFMDAKTGRPRGLDGFIISKCDTVGDMVGTLVSMVHATGIPVVFLGVGQHYGDLRGLNVGWAVDKLMK